MELDNTVDAVKKYWPWALGALAAVFLYSRLTSGSSDTTSNLSGSLYDPNLMANNLAMSQVAAGIQQAQITAEAQNNQAAWQAIASGFQFASNANSDFQAGQIAAYQATKDISINAANVMGNTTVAGLDAASNASAAFHNMIGQSTQSAAQIVSAVAQANARTTGIVSNNLFSVITQ